MRIKARCTVRASISIPSEFTFQQDDRTYVFLPDATGNLVEITIEAPIPDPERFRSSITPIEKGLAKFHLKVEEDDELVDSIREDFQLIESLMSFEWDLEGISWGEMGYDLIFENEGERQGRPILGGIQVQSKPRVNRFRLESGTLAELLKTKDSYRHLSVVFAFYRQGKHAHARAEFITAFFNFYFVLEGLFANGKTKNKLVEEEFKKAGAIQEGVPSILENMRIHQPAVYSKLVKEIGTPVGPSIVDATITFLVKQRGRLHHFTHGSSRKQGTPFSHSDYEHVSELARGLATMALMYSVVDANRRAGRVDSFDEPDDIADGPEADAQVLRTIMEPEPKARNAWDRASAEPLHYSTDTDAAYKVMLRMTSYGWGFMRDIADAELNRRGGFRVHFSRGEHRVTAEAQTLSLAICRAALEAIKLGEMPEA